MQNENLLVILAAFVLTPSSDQATTGIDFNFTCFYTFTQFVIIYRDNKAEFAVRGYGDCSMVYDPKGYYRYTCNENILVLVIPGGTFELDNFHGSVWYCHSLDTTFSNTVVLYVNSKYSYDTVKLSW